MKRLAVVVMALLACVAFLAIAQVVVGQVGPRLLSHWMNARWFVPACNLFLAACFVVASLRRKKAAKEDDEPLTPVVRRDPVTGLRQL